MLCKYKDLFGKPDTGVHKFRIFNIAIVDTLLTLLLAWALQKWIWPDCNLWLLFALLIILSVFVHRLFCVPTTLTKFFFPGMKR